MSTKQKLLEYKVKVDGYIKDVFEQQKEEAGKISPFVRDFVSNIAEFTLRDGKRIRPALIYYGYKLFNGKDDDEIIKLSAYLELIHAYLLIHDDIMDRATLRRGEATIHKIYESYSNNHNFGDDHHFGNAMGIIAGDLANTVWLKFIANSNIDATKKSQLMSITAREISNVIYGQIHDILLTYPVEYSDEDIEQVHFLKTATYTFKLPLQLGAMLAGASDEEQIQLEKYSIPCGKAFQLRDDILGAFGDDENTGKSSMSDLREGKKTFLVSKAYENANLEDKQKLDRYLGDLNLNDSEADELRSIFRSTNSLNYSIERCEELVTEAKSSLKKLDNCNQEAYNFLDELADYMIIRDL